MEIRKADERGVANFGWLDSKHTFSFGHYYDSNFMGYGPLRVINEDKVQAGAGFPPHGHADMEIISYVIKGALEHEDDKGNSSIIRPGEVQKMSAGKGIRHSEHNFSDTDGVHFLQIWIIPDKKGITPGYQQKSFPELKENDTDLILLLNPEGKLDSLSIQQDVDVYGAKLDSENELHHQLLSSRIGWVQMVKGSMVLNDEEVVAGDGIAIGAGKKIRFTNGSGAEFLLFDMHC